jgi:hypothetical protein
MHTDDHPYCSPATIISLRPVTLRPYLSISLPSEYKILNDNETINPIQDERSAFCDER